MNRAWILRGVLFLFALGLMACGPKSQESEAPHREEWIKELPLYGDVAKVTVTQYRYLEENGEYIKGSELQTDIYEFNNEGNVTKHTLEFPSASAHHRRGETYLIEYDGKGRKIGKYSNYDTCNIKYKYDDEGRLIEESFLHSNDDNKNGGCDTLPDFRRLYKYDSKGNLIEERAIDYIHFENCDAWRCTYKYDTKGRKTEQYSYQAEYLDVHTIFEYKGNKCISQSSWDGNNKLFAKKSYKYDDNNRKIEELTYDDNGKVDITRVYKYDSQGNIVEFTDKIMLGKKLYGEIHKYKYDTKGNRIEDLVYWLNMTPKLVTEYTIEYRE